MTRLFSPFLFTALFLTTASIQAIEYQGIEFPGGAISFADEVVSYKPNFSGGEEPKHEDFIDPQDSVGDPDYPHGEDMQPGSVSIGSGGRLVLRFIDNALSGSNSEAPDLHIFEVGSDVEDTFVEISEDGKNWHEVGKVSGAISSIDIDAYGFNSSDRFYFVRLTDDENEGRNTGETVGADIDAVGAISTVPSENSRSQVLLIIAIVFAFLTFWIAFSPLRKSKSILCLVTSAFSLLSALLLLVIFFSGLAYASAALLYIVWTVLVAVFLVSAWRLGVTGKGVVASSKLFVFCWLPIVIALVALLVVLLMFVL